MYYDSTYILVIIGFVICMIAQNNVKSTFRKYSEVYSKKGIKAEEVAQMILANANITDVGIARVSGQLSDHYDPRSKMVNLSESVYGSSSVAAIGVAAHECGHVIQHHLGYQPLIIRNAIVPAVNISSKAAMPLIFIGLIFSISPLITVGIVLFSAIVLFQLITLPVEFNASKRAVEILGNSNMLYDDELEGAGKVLTAAALTYIAATISTMLQLVRLILIRQRRD